MIGGAAGCFPVLVGWAAVKGTIAIPAILLFLVIFLWTPPHFWALAMKFKDDYARANVPMLPVVATPAVVTRKIVIYSYAMVAATLALAPYAGWLYTAAAVGLGGWFLVEAHRLHAQVTATAATAQQAQTAPSRCACSTSPSPTSPCCSSWWRSARCSRSVTGRKPRSTAPRCPVPPGSGPTTR